MIRRKIFNILFIALIVSQLSYSQNCSILSKANDISPDKLCSPVTASWNVRYTGVTDAGTPVSIRYDWDDGSIQTIPANKIGAGVFEATSGHTYTSQGDRCNYHPQATLIVNGIACTSSTQEQIVTVWDDDDHNGGEMHISPEVYPICVGNGGNVRFQDLTQFNCVPPQERDNPNINTRWVQWIYGTASTMTGIPVSINSVQRTFPYTGSVISLPGPVTGSGVWSDVINVANDKLVGQYFQVTLRNWNYCNPYIDPNVPPGQHNLIDGDHPPVVTTAIILIVPYPDATINPVTPMCANASSVTLTAHDPGGVWSGPGVSGNRFNPSVAGPGTHTISYTITNQNNCSDSDTETITVLPVPDAKITPLGILCTNDPVQTLTAATPGGTWSGTAVTGNTFDPAAAGVGNHVIRYDITVNGCTSFNEITINVATPDATINPVDTLCVNGPPVTLTAHDGGGVWIGDGIVGNVFYPPLAGPGDHQIIYDLNNPNCSDSDTTNIFVVDVPVVNMTRVGTLYINSAPETLHATPSGGVFTGTGVTGLFFDPNIAGVGEHVITYTTQADKFGCYSEDTIHIQVIIPPVPTAFFQPDTSGCSPIAVHFRNLSIAGESYVWDFDDGTYSVEKNPTHTYYVPGTYIVRLTVVNIVGTSSHTGTIKVFQSPTAVFDVYPPVVSSRQQVVVFYNYSYYATTFLWDFGDSTSSTEKNPWHRYKNSGSYDVILWATSDEGCVDTTHLKTPISVDWKTGNIDFPNVFRWNGSGPTGGVWRDGVYPEMDNVFRPFFENVTEYRLQIFNRWGVLIYESHDLYKGWDGYFGDGNLAIQGVYVWKAKGQFADGSFFNKVGDVTFLH